MIDIQISTRKAPVKFREPPSLKKIQKKKDRQETANLMNFSWLIKSWTMYASLICVVLFILWQANVVVYNLSRTFILQSKSLCNKENLLLYWKSFNSMTEMKPIFPFQYDPWKEDYYLTVWVTIKLFAKISQISKKSSLIYLFILHKMFKYFFYQSVFSCVQTLQKSQDLCFHPANIV